MNERERAALLRNNQQELARSRRRFESGHDYSSEALERHAEAVTPASLRRPDHMNDYFQGPAGRLLTGDEPARKKERDKLELNAKSFRYDAEQERMLEWEAKGDPKFDALNLSPQQRMSLGYYRRAKAAAKELGLPTGDPHRGR